jgi:hypothetical protein
MQSPRCCSSRRGLNLDLASMPKENRSRASSIRYPVEAVQVLCSSPGPGLGQAQLSGIMHANNRLVDVRYHFRDIAELIQFTGGSPISIYSFDSVPVPNTGIILARQMLVMDICVMLEWQCRFSLSNTSPAIVIFAQKGYSNPILRSLSSPGSLVAIAHFADRSHELRFVSTICLE